MKKKLVTVLVVAGLCLGVVVTRAVWEGRAALSAAGDALEAGDPHEAVALYRRAARWYVPLAPHVGRAYDQLEIIAQQAEQSGDTDLALAAWRGVRSSIKATRSFFTPQEHRLDRANKRIAALMAQIEGPEADPGKSQQQREQWHYDLLDRDEAPSVFWSIVALLGFGMWLGGGVLFAVRGVSREDDLVPRMAAASGILVAVGLVVWMLGLYKA